MANSAAALKLESDIQELNGLVTEHKVETQESDFVKLLKQKKVIIMCGLFVCFCIMAFCQVIIANQDYQRQRVSRQLALLENEKRHNMLELERSASTIQLMEKATKIGLAHPSNERVHIIKTASTGPSRQIAKVKSTKSAWAKQGSMWAAVFKRIGHGPGVATLND